MPLALEAPEVQLTFMKISGFATCVTQTGGGSDVMSLLFPSSFSVMTARGILRVLIQLQLEVDPDCVLCSVAPVSGVDGFCQSNSVVFVFPSCLKLSRAVCLYRGY